NKTLENEENVFIEAIEFLKKFLIINGSFWIDRQLKAGKTILAEGAQGTLLDIDHGNFPFVTSSSTIAGGVCIGLGIAPNRIGKIYGLFKAYCTRVGSGPFPTELFDETGEKLQKQGNEFGSTTGRPRRCGWLDIPSLKYAVMINGVTNLVMTKGDVLSIFETLKVATSYNYNNKKNDYLPFDISDNKAIPEFIELPGWKVAVDKIQDVANLPAELLSYINFIEKSVKTRITILSLGPDRKQTFNL
ncbi:MAG: adenylosuccinate synthetase, partial [Bacteroidota bacterium]